MLILVGALNRANRIILFSITIYTIFCNGPKLCLGLQCRTMGKAAIGIKLTEKC